MGQGSQSSAFWFQPIWSPCAFAQPERFLPPGRVGGWFLYRSSESCQIVPHVPQEAQNQALDCCLTSFLYFLRSLTPSVVAVCPFGAQEAAAFPSKKKQGTWKGSCAQESPPQRPAQFQIAWGLVYGVNVTERGWGNRDVRLHGFFFSLFSCVLTEVKSCLVNDMK